MFSQGLEGRGLEDTGLVLSASGGFAHLCDPGCGTAFHLGG